jgi:hypothetical protein
MSTCDISKEKWRQFREQVLRALDIELVYRDIRRSGRNNANGWVSAYCPFHEDNNSSFAFCVEDGPSKGNWNCFAGCGHGSVFDFWSKTHGGIQYIDCLEALAKMFQVELIWTNANKEEVARIEQKPFEQQVEEQAQTQAEPSQATETNQPIIQPAPPVGEKLARDENDLSAKKNRQVDIQVVIGWHKRLLSLPDRLEYLHSKRGLSIETIKEFKIGWSSRLHRYTIPILDENGICRNIRMYDPHRTSGKVINFTETLDGKRISYGSPIRLFNLDQLVKRKDEPIILTEGETDALVTYQHGFLAVSGTGGCMAFRPEWLPFFEGRDVIICYDCDEKGKKAVVEVVGPVLSSLKLNSLKILTLPLAGTSDDKDLTDFFVKRQKTADDLKKLIQDQGKTDSSEFNSFPTGGGVGIPGDVIMLSSFTEVEKNEYIGKKVRCIIVASGETSESFHAVKKFKIAHCKNYESGRCPCILKNNGVYDIPPNARERIGSCMATDITVMNMLRDFCCSRGARPTIEILEKETITEFFCHQDATRFTISDDTLADNEGNELLEKRVYLTSPERPKLGRYAAIGWVTSNPRTQQITLLIEHLQALEDDYQSFDLAKHKHELEYLQGLEYDDIVNFLSTNVVKIYKRPQLILAVLLTLLSPRWLHFNDERIRGWINSLVVGDVGAGKSQTYTRISDFVSVGDVFSGLTGSRTGLVYGLSEHKQKGWQVRAGRIPSNSRKALMIDEAHMLQAEDIRTMSKGMDEGFVQIDRISSGGYETQTRIQIIANPAGDGTMDKYLYGCEAIKELLPPAVVRRLDFAVIVNAMDVADLDILNLQHDVGKLSNLKIVGSTLRSLIYWAWNLDMRDIHYESEAVSAVLTNAKNLSMMFGDAHDIPLVNPSDVRKKLARIAAAVAVLDVSTEFGNPALVIKARHVEYATNFLKQIYTAENFKLDEYATVQGMKVNITDYDELDEVIMKADELMMAMLFMLKHQPVVRRSDLPIVLGVKDGDVAKCIQVLRAYNLISPYKFGNFIRTTRFNRFMRKFSSLHLDYMDRATGLYMSKVKNSKGVSIDKISSKNGKGKNKNRLTNIDEELDIDFDGVDEAVDEELGDDGY